MPKMERTDSVGATSITCNNPGFTFYYMIILFPINCLPDTTNVHLFWRGKHINVTVKVKFSAFRTMCGFNFIPWKRVIFFYMGSFSRKGNETWIFFITLINRLVDELLSNDIYSLPKTTSVSFPFSSFLFRSQHQHSIPRIPSSIYGHLL